VNRPRKGKSVIKPVLEFDWKGETLPLRCSQIDGLRINQVVGTSSDVRATKAVYMAESGLGILWQSDFENGKLLLSAMSRRIKPLPPRRLASLSLTERFHAERYFIGKRANILNKLLLRVEERYFVPNRRAPTLRIKPALEAAFGPAASYQPFLIPLQHLLGVLGAYQIRSEGVEIPQFPRGVKVHPHFGVFAPIRNEYLSLVQRTPLPQPCRSAWDVGTGTGVLGCILALRGVLRVLCTDNSPNAVACARETAKNLHLSSRVEVLQCDLLPSASHGLVTDLIVCNPPWIPEEPANEMDKSVFDGKDSVMLRGVLQGAKSRLSSHGEMWLILSDLAERLGLRSRSELLSWIDDAGLTIKDIVTTPAAHKRARDETDPLHVARSQEQTELFILQIKQ